jgi:hypothetical protein
MKFRSHSILIVIVVLATSVRAQDPQVIVQVDRQEIYEGESILYRVTLNHFDKPTPPALKGFDDFQVEALGDQSLNSTRITIINGRRTEVVRRGQQYNYRLVPQRTGTLTIPAPTARAGNEVLEGRTVALRVIPPQDQDTAILEMTLDRKSVYPMQPFRVTLNVVVKDLPARFAKTSPLGVQQSAPELHVPWLDDEQIPKGIEPESDWRKVLEPALNARGQGFQINNIGQSSAFSLFGRQATVFRPAPLRTRRKDKSGQTTGYWEFRFTRTFVPRRVGTYQFGPATVKGTFATRAHGDRLIGEEVYAVARAVPITVKSVPVDGRPDSFVGAVGQFEFSSQLVPTKANVGDPMTLTLTLTGQGTLEEAVPPDLNEVPEIGVRFKTYEATTETSGNTRRFTYSLRPMQAGRMEFPELPVSYFDVERERYVTLRSAAIPIEIGESERLSNDQIVANPNQRASSTDPLQVREGGLFANDADWRSLRNETLQPLRWTVAWSGMIGCYVLTTLAIGHARRRHSDPALVRRRGATGTARQTIKSALAHLRSGDEDAVYRQLRGAFANLVADVTNTSAEGMTPGDVEARLLEVGIADELAHRTREFFESCDAHRYGDGSDQSGPLTQQAESLLEQLLASLKGKKVLR